MPFPQFNVYHCIAAKLQAGGVPLVFPKFPPTWQRAFSLYESPWSNNGGGEYNVDLVKFNRYLDGVQNPKTDPVYLWETHSAGSCEVDFDGPIVLDMERFAFTQKPAAFADVMRRCQAWRPKAQWMFYGSVSRWASQWDSDPVTYMALNDSYNAAVYSFHKHIPLYLQTADTAAQWETWNNKNIMELVRQCAVTGGKPYAMVRPQQSPDGGTTWPVITTIAQALAQVRPAIRLGVDIQVWDYWTTNAERDAALPGLALIDQAISQARAELWSV